jgi:hypothetical protein
MADLFNEISQLRQQGLTDNLIALELEKQGFAQDQIDLAMHTANSPGMPPTPDSSMGMSAMGPPDSGMNGDANIYERIEEMTESMIDEKWDELLGEVKKIVEWKEEIEERQNKIDSEVKKLQNDFKILHEGVLGKLETYDDRMRDVGTDLKAVGKVFKDVIPEFVENVKELKSMTKKS